MSEQKPALSAQFFLSLEESQDGFSLATFGKNQLTRYVTPLVSIGIIVWGLTMDFQDVGRYYVGLGVFFLILQMLMRFWFLPMMFKRQYDRYQFGKNEQGIHLYQDAVEFTTMGRAKRMPYTDIRHFAEGKLTFMLEMKDRVVVIVPKRVFNAEQLALFKRTFQR